MGFMAGALPFLQQAGMGAASAAGSMAINKAGQAAFGEGVENANQAQPAGGGPQQAPAFQILQALQQQMQQQEMQRQQAIQTLLAQFSQPQPRLGQATQTESRG